MTILRFGNTTSQLTDKISDLVPRTTQLQDLFDTYPNGVRHGTTFMALTSCAVRIGPQVMGSEV